MKVSFPLNAAHCDQNAATQDSVVADICDIVKEKFGGCFFEIEVCEMEVFTSDDWESGNAGEVRKPLDAWDEIPEQSRERPLIVRRKGSELIFFSSEMRSFVLHSFLFFNKKSSFLKPKNLIPPPPQRQIKVHPMGGLIAKRSV